MKITENEIRTAIELLEQIGKKLQKRTKRMQAMGDDVESYQKDIDTLYEAWRTLKVTEWDE